MPIIGLIPKPLLKRHRKGDELKARDIDNHALLLDRIVGGVRPADQVVNRANVVPVTIALFSVVSDEGDYLLCYTWNGTTLGEDTVKVAKPYLLRQAPFDGDTDGRNGFTYVYSSVSVRVSTKTSDSSTVTQEITPAYVEGDEIIAANGLLRGTNVTFNVNGEDKNVDWIDLNLDGRQWAKQES